MKKIYINREDILKDLKQKDNRIIIFGAGEVGKKIYGLLEENGVEVYGFCDNNADKVGQHIFGKKILSLPLIKKENIKVSFIISSSDVKHIIEQLEKEKYFNWYLGGLILENENLLYESYFDRYVLNNCIVNHKAFSNKNVLFANSVDLIITERCSLKCKDCCNLMQYYKNPKDCNLEKLYCDLDKLDSVFDDINELRIIGGEPFMNKNIHKIVDRAIEKQSIRYIIVYTNGTIIPTNEQCEIFKNEKVIISITNYKKHSKNITEVTKILEKSGVHYRTSVAEAWTNCSEIQRHKRSQEELKSMFSDCCVSSAITLSDGKLFRCPFEANLHRLKAIPQEEFQYFDLFNVLEYENYIENLKLFLYNKNFINACNYCNGRSIYSIPDLEPAIQTKNPLKYTCFE